MAFRSQRTPIGAAFPEKRLRLRMGSCHLKTSQSDQAPSYHLCCNMLFMSRANTSMRPLPQETTAGLELSAPPSDSQLCKVPSYKICCKVLSFPRTKTSNRPVPQDVTAGSDVKL